MHCQNKSVLDWGSMGVGMRGRKKGACWVGGNKSFTIPGAGAATPHSSVHTVGTVGCCGLQNLLSVSSQLDSEDAEPNFDEDGRDEYNELHMPV